MSKTVGDITTQSRPALKEDLGYLRRIWKLIYQLDAPALWLTIVLSIVQALRPFINIILPAMVIDELLGQRSVQRLIILCAWIVGLNLALFLVGKGLENWFKVRREILHHKTELKMMEKTVTMDYEHIEDPKVQQMRQGIHDVRNYNGGIFEFMRQVNLILRDLFLLLFSAGTMAQLFVSTSLAGSTGWKAFMASPWASVLLLGLILFSTLINSWINLKSGKAANSFTEMCFSTNRMFSYLSGELINDYKNGKDIRLFSMTEMLHEKERGYQKEFLGLLFGLYRYMGNMSALIAVVSALMTGLIYLFVGLKVMIGIISVGGLVLYVGAIQQFNSGVSGILNGAAMMRIQAQSMRHYLNYLDLPFVKHRGKLPVEKRNDDQYEIEVRNVSFKYPGSDSYTLKNVSLKLRIGERLAVVGMNGAGKTTLIKLLCRLYDPTEGEILLNGIDICKYDYNEYLSLFSVVFQDFKLFSFPLGQNVAASTQPDPGLVWECLEEAGVAERVQRMPRGLETPLYKDFEEDGVEISGGEAQKIAIARALYKDAPFIILDEPTAALDPIAEFDIYSKFDTLVGSKTAIYISHRLSSCRFCHDIAVFDQGKLIQRGCHDTLIADPQGKYYALWHAQAQYYDEQMADPQIA